MLKQLGILIYLRNRISGTSRLLVVYMYSDTEVIVMASKDERDIRIMTAMMMNL
jgi:hypothetical protein